MISLNLPDFWMVSFNDEIKEGKQSTVVSSLQLEGTGDKQNKLTEQSGFKVTLIWGNDALKMHHFKLGSRCRFEHGPELQNRQKTDSQTVRQTHRQIDR